MKIGGGLQWNSGGELKLYLGCTGSTSSSFLSFSCYGYWVTSDPEAPDWTDYIAQSQKSLALESAQVISQLQIQRTGISRYSSTCKGTKFKVLNRLVWPKNGGEGASMHCVGGLRDRGPRWAPPPETNIFQFLQGDKVVPCCFAALRCSWLPSAT